MSRLALNNPRPLDPRPRLAAGMRTRLTALRVVPLALLFALGGGAAAPAAQAGKYRAYACTTPDGAPISLKGSEWTTSKWNSVVWQDPETIPSKADHSCDSRSGLVTLNVGAASTAQIPAGESVQWDFQAPDALSLSYVSFFRKVLLRTNGGDQSASLRFQAFASEATRNRSLDDCWSFEPCVRGHVDSSPFEKQNEVGYTLDRARYLRFQAMCTGTRGGFCAGDGVYPRGMLYFGGFKMDVEDFSKPLAPEIKGTAILAPSDPQKGPRALDVSATDSGSGVREVRAWIDNTLAATGTDNNDGQCVDAGFAAGPDYRALVPCRLAASIGLDFDSRDYADGSHRLRVEVIDAAGNSNYVHDSEVLFENYDPPKNVVAPLVNGSKGDPRPNDVLSATTGEWQAKVIDDVKYTYRWQRSQDGAAWGNIPGATTSLYQVTRADIGHELRVEVTATDGEGPGVAVSESTAKVQTGATISPAGFADGTEVPSASSNGGSGDPSTAQLVVDREQRTVAVKYGAKIVVTGRLVDKDSQPIPNADVDVFEQVAITAAPWVKIGTVTTDSQGGYVFRPKTTASRRLRFAFADKRDAANYRATREVSVEVEGAMTISAKRKVLTAGQTIRLKGRLTVDQLPKTGTWVEVQVLDAGVWRTIATRKTSSKGLWTFKHRLRQSSGITFRFRSRLRPVGDVASAETKSPTLKVRVR